MQLATLIYRSDFSVLFPAGHAYLTALVSIAQTFVVEVSETVMQAGYDRADWFYGVWAIAHYSELPAIPEDYEVEPDYWFEPLEPVVIPAASQLLLVAPQGFVPFALLNPSIDHQLTVKKTKRTRKSAQPTEPPVKSKRGRKPKAAIAA